MGKIAIYARVSTKDKQDFKRQISDCKTAIGDSYTQDDIEIFAEVISGYKKMEQRPQLESLLSKIEINPNYFDCIYITEISRLGRDPKQTRELIDRLTEKKIPIHITSINRKTLDADGERDSIMNIIIQVLIEFSDSESKTLKKRSQSGLLESAKFKGNAGGGKYLPYGYTKDKTKKLIVDDGEAIVIKQIFNLYKEDNGCKKIAGYLNDNKIPTRVSKFGSQIMNFNIEKVASDINWSDKTINDIIRNSIYKGDRKFKGQILNAPAIISTQLYDECIEIMDSKTHRNYLTTYTYLLKDLLVCGCCGRNYFAKYKPVEGGDKVYICSSRLKRNGNCGNIGVNISFLESVIFNEFNNSDTFLHYLKNTNLKKTIQAKLKKIRHDLIIEEKSFEKKENEKQRLLDLYLASKIDLTNYEKNYEKLNKEEIDLATKIKLIKKEIFDNNKALSKQDDSIVTRQILNDAKNNRTELQVIFKQFIKKIIINKIDNKMVLATLFSSINGIELPTTLKIILDLSGMKKKPIRYSYTGINQMSSEPIFNKNILTTSIIEIDNEIQSKMEFIEWENILDKNILSIY